MALIRETCGTCGTAGYSEEAWGLIDAGWRRIIGPSGRRGMWQCGNCGEMEGERAAAECAAEAEREEAERERYDSETVDRFGELARAMREAGWMGREDMGMVERVESILRRKMEGGYRSGFSRRDPALTGEQKDQVGAAVAVVG